MQTLIIYANSVPHSEQCSHMQTVFRYTISVIIVIIKNIKIIKNSLTIEMIYVILMTKIITII